MAAKAEVADCGVDLRKFQDSPRRLKNIKKRRLVPRNGNCQEPRNAYAI